MPGRDTTPEYKLVYPFGPRTKCGTLFDLITTEKLFVDPKNSFGVGDTPVSEFPARSHAVPDVNSVPPPAGRINVPPGFELVINE